MVDDGVREERKRTKGCGAVFNRVLLATGSLAGEERKFLLACNEKGFEPSRHKKLAGYGLGGQSKGRRESTSYS